MDSLYFIESNFISIQKNSLDDPSSAGEPLLSFDDLSYIQRNEILKEILAVHLQSGLTSDEVNKLKSLKLLTKVSGESFAGNKKTIFDSNRLRILLFEIYSLRLPKCILVCYRGSSRWNCSTRPQ